MRLENVAESFVVAENIHNINLKLIGKSIEFMDIVKRIHLDPNENYNGFTQGSNIHLKLSLSGYEVSIRPDNVLEVLYGQYSPTVVKTFSDSRIKPIYNRLVSQISKIQKKKK